MIYDEFEPLPPVASIYECLWALAGPPEHCSWFSLWAAPYVGGSALSCRTGYYEDNYDQSIIYFLTIWFQGNNATGQECSKSKIISFDFGSSHLDEVLHTYCSVSHHSLLPLTESCCPALHPAFWVSPHPLFILPVSVLLCHYPPHSDETTNSSVLPQFPCVGGSPVLNALLASESLDLQFEQVDVLQPLVVVEVALAEDWLLDPDLLKQQSTFIISLQQLFPKAVSLSYYLRSPHKFSQQYVTLTDFVDILLYLLQLLLLLDLFFLHGCYYILQFLLFCSLALNKLFCFFQLQFYWL